MGQYDVQEGRIKRQQMIAQALRASGNQGFDPAASAGRLVYARSPWEDINKVAQMGAASYLDSKASKAADELNAQKTADARTRLGGMLDVLVGKSQNVLDQPSDPALTPFSGDATVQNPITGQSATVGVGTEQNQKRAALAGMLKGQDPQEAVAALQGPALERALAQPEKLDVGGQFVWRDPITGKITSQLEKTATKDAQLGADVSLQGQKTTAETQRRAQDISESGNIRDNATSRANAALAASTAIRGQNLDLEGIRLKTEAEVGKGQKVTVDERKAATLATRLKNSLSVLETVGKTNPNALTPNVAAEAFGAISGVGEFARNAINSGDRQRVDNAQLDALDAALTLSTGAAYTKEQLRIQALAHFPQVWDSEQTKADKAARLKALVEAAQAQAGGAYANTVPITDAFSAATGGNDAAPVTKTIGGKTYVKTPEGWMEQ